MIIIDGHLSKSSKSLSGPSTSSPSQSLDDSLSVLMLPFSLDLSWDGRSNLWNQVIGDQKPRPRKNTFSSSSLGWPPSPTPLYNGISRSLEGELVVLQNFLGHFYFETGKTCARVVCVLGWWWWRRDWCPLPPPSTSSYGGCFLRPVGSFQCIFSKITGFGFQLLLEISQQDNMISLDICQRGGGVNDFCENLVTGGVKMTGNSCV